MTRKNAKADADNFGASDCGNNASGDVRRTMKLPFYFSLMIAFGFASCTTVPETRAPVPTTFEGYKKLVEDRLGPHWDGFVKVSEDLVAVGTVKATFEIPAEGGRARNLKIVSNTGNEVDERIARAAIGRLRAPPIPPAILQREDKDYVLFEESFTIFDNAKPIPSPTPLKKR
jgi:hypothetical protein